MTDATQKNRSKAAVRQARFKQRMEASGYRKVSVWLHQGSESIGYEAGFLGGELLPVPGEVIDHLSYCSGWLRGAGDRTSVVKCTACGVVIGEGLARDYFDLLSGAPFDVVCDECEPSDRL